MRGVRHRLLRQRLVAAGVVVLALCYGAALPAAYSASQRKSSKRPQAQLTVLTGADKGVVRIRSTRFFCSLCATHTIQMLRAQRGVQQVTVKDDVKPVTVEVYFDPNLTNTRMIGNLAKRALENEAGDNAVVKLVFGKAARR